MTHSQATKTGEIASSLSLIKATIAAFISAIIILICIVLPAEFAIDITGTGKLLGLQTMGKIKQSLALEQAELDQKVLTNKALSPSPETKMLAEQEAKVFATQETSVQAPTLVKVSAQAKTILISNDALPKLMTDSRTLVLENGEAAELKVALAKGQYVDFEWKTNAKVNFDNHGDSDNIRYHPYTKGKGVMQDEGRIQAAFNGYHGWFWRNRSGKQVSLTINFTGEYTKVKRVL
ncbi:hypothetical protein [Marinomonas sp. PE14-40]|uniref:hypothetical protein n=1 Tax=Marinomonas sp. PE14-40 TaxID=3060621 RepID=UPI003F67F77F